MVPDLLPSRVLVVGLGASGVAAARLAAADGADVRVTDRRPAADLTDVSAGLPERASTFFGGHPEGCLDGVSLMVVSPGVPPDVPLIVAGRQRGIEVVGEVEFAWRHRPDATLIAVTGSNGKSTVTELTGRMVRASGFPAAVGGNLGPAASELVLQGGWDTWVLEISSFQAEILTAMSPRAAVFLNLSQDHLERHTDLGEYLEAKRRLFTFQTSSDVAVLNGDDPAVIATPTVARRRVFSLEGPADACLFDENLMVDGEVLMATSRLALSGLHNVGNALAAVLAATAIGVPKAAIIETLQSFEGLAHRHKTVHEEDGVRWVDDSKATNVGATIAALRGYPAGTVHLILGGQGKGQDFAPLRAEIERAVSQLYLIGEDGVAIGEVLSGAAPVEVSRTLDAAVARARAAAKPGDTVLLAPACASFDQFTGYADRGDRFATLARREVAPCR